MTEDNRTLLSVVCVAPEEAGTVNSVPVSDPELRIRAAEDKVLTALPEGSAFFVAPYVSGCADRMARVLEKLSELPTASAVEILKKLNQTFDILLDEKTVEAPKAKPERRFGFNG